MIGKTEITTLYIYSYHDGSGVVVIVIKVYLIEVLKHGGKLSAGWAPVGREVVQHQLLERKQHLNLKFA